VQKIIGKKSLADLSNEDRQKVFAKIRELGGGGRPGGGGEGAGGPGGGRRERGGEPVMATGELSPREKAEEEKRNQAKLPLAPEEDSQLQVLLRPGLLANVEIIVEKVANAIHIPSQAVFDKDGKTVVYIQTAGRFQPRVIKPLKRSESVMVVAEGLKENDVIAMADPTARSGGKKDDKGSTKSGVPSGGGRGPM
ncbi:MAG: hypothetical protein ACRD96_12505, partial [Bryobacteraceae bacterium]